MSNEEVGHNYAVVHIRQSVNKRFTRQKNIESRNIEDENDKNEINSIKRRNSIIIDIDKNDNFIQEINSFNVMLRILNKITPKKPSDHEIIARYLSTFPDISKFNKNISSTNFESILIKMSEKMVYNKYDKNKIFFITGDHGDKCYIILKGKVVVLIPERKVMMMDIKEYYQYLSTLLLYDEVELYNRCILENSSIFPVRHSDKNKILALQEEIKNIKEKAPDNLSNLSFINFYMERVRPVVKEEDPETTLRRQQMYHYETYNFDDFDGVKKKEEEIDVHKKEKVIIYEYHGDLIFKTGQFFGNFALENPNSKRTATVIADEDCHIGVFDHRAYSELIKSIVDQVKDENQDLILTCKLFKNIKAPSFSKNYYHKFISMTYQRNEKIFVEGDTKTYIIFNKEGEFEMKLSASIFEIGEMIKCLKGEKFKNPKEYMFQSDDKEIKEIMNLKRTSRLFITNSIDVLGMLDMFEQNRYWYTLVCNSVKNEVFRVKKEDLDVIIDQEIKKLRSTTDNPMMEFINDKKKCFAKRLEAIKKELLKEVYRKKAFSFELTYHVTPYKDVDKPIKNFEDAKDNPLYNPQSIIDKMEQNVEQKSNDNSGYRKSKAVQNNPLKSISKGFEKPTISIDVRTPNLSLSNSTSNKQIKYVFPVKAKGFQSSSKVRKENEMVFKNIVLKRDEYEIPEKVVLDPITQTLQYKPKIVLSKKELEEHKLNEEIKRKAKNKSQQTVRVASTELMNLNKNADELFGTVFNSYIVYKFYPSSSTAEVGAGMPSPDVRTRISNNNNNPDNIYIPSITGYVPLSTKSKHPSQSQLSIPQPQIHPFSPNYKETIHDTLFFSHFHDSYNSLFHTNPKQKSDTKYSGWRKHNYTNFNLTKSKSTTAVRATMTERAKIFFKYLNNKHSQEKTQNSTLLKQEIKKNVIKRNSALDNMNKGSL